MMKKQFVLTLTLLTSIMAFAVASYAKTSTKIINTRIVQATKDTTVTYAGVKIFVSQGETVILGQREDGTIVIRSQSIKGMKINGSTVSFPGTTVLSVDPQSNVITVNRGNDVSVTDANGRTAVLSQGASVSATDIRAATNPALGNTQATTNVQKALAKAQAKTAKQEAKITKAASRTQTARSSEEDAAKADATALPAFVAESVVSSTASEQASQNVKETEETLSNSSAY